MGLVHAQHAIAFAPIVRALRCVSRTLTIYTIRNSPLRGVTHFLILLGKKALQLFSERCGFFCPALRFSSGICRKRDYVCLFGRNRRECHFLCLCKAVFVAQMSIRFHCQRPAVFVSQPAGNGRNVYAGFYAARREQVPQIMMSDALRSDFLTGAIQSFLRLTDTKHLYI